MDMAMMMEMEMAWRAYASEMGWDGDDMETSEIAEMAITEIDMAREYGMDMSDISEGMMAWADMHR